MWFEQEVLVPEAYEFDQWEPEGASSNPVTAVIPTWRTLTTLDMSHNSIAQIDNSVVRVHNKNTSEQFQKGHRRYLFRS